MFEIQACKASDIEDVVHLSYNWANEEITHGMAPNSAAELETRLGSYFWVARMGRDLVGYIMGTGHVSDGLAEIPANEKYLEIDEVYVTPEYRNSGLGHQLVDRVLTEAQSNGISRSVVYSATKQRQEIVRFYEKHEFKMWYVQMYR